MPDKNRTKFILKFAAVLTLITPIMSILVMYVWGWLTGVAFPQIWASLSGVIITIVVIALSFFLNVAGIFLFYMFEEDEPLPLSRGFRAFQMITPTTLYVFNIVIWAEYLTWVVFPLL